MAAKRNDREIYCQDKTDKVGCGKPPKKHQFKPGQSGNPKGKRKGSKNRTTILRESLNGKIWIVEDGTRRKISRFEALIRAIVDSALKHRDFKFVELLLKLSEQVGAADQRLAAKAKGPGYVLIDTTMTNRETAAAYAATLAAIPGMAEPNFEIDYF